MTIELAAEIARYCPIEQPEESLKRILAHLSCKEVYAPDIYCTNFMLAGRVVEIITKHKLDAIITGETARELVIILEASWNVSQSH